VSTLEAEIARVLPTLDPDAPLPSPDRADPGFAHGVGAPNR